MQSRPYLASRKEAIIAALNPICRGGDLDVRAALKQARVEAFIKDESYPIPPEGEPDKPPRLICARNDLGKCIYGPIFEPLNAEFFSLAFSLKHVCWNDRPRYIDEYLTRDGFEYVSIDYSSYESCQRRLLMRVCE